MNWAYLHLALNHVPVIGLPIAVFVMVIAHLKKSEELKRLGLLLFFLLAVASVPVYFTGEPAEDVMKNLPAFDSATHDIVEEHEEMALLAFIGMEILGALALASLVLSRKFTFLASQTFLKALVTLSVVLCLALGWVSRLGGAIRHTETRSSATDAPGKNAD